MDGRGRGMFPPSVDGENNNTEAGGIGFRVVVFVRGEGTCLRGIAKAG